MKLVKVEGRRFLFGERKLFMLVRTPVESEHDV